MGYISVPLDQFRLRSKTISFDVYLKLSETNFAHIFSRNSGIDYVRLENYRKRGVSELFVRKEDESALHSWYSSSVMDQLIKSDGNSKQILGSLLQLTELGLAEAMTRYAIPSDTAELCQQTIEGYVKLLHSDPQSLEVLLTLVGGGSDLYGHSITVSVLSLLVAHEMGSVPEDEVRAIGLGAFLHDIGAVEPFGNPNVQELSHLHESRAEGLWREHPKLGLQKLESTQNLSQEVRWILYQHHEEPGGKGFPNGLDTREGKRTIYRGALLVGAIDSFVCKMFGRVDAEASAVLDQMSTEPERWDPLYLKLLKMLFERKNASTRKRAS